MRSDWDVCESQEERVIIRRQDEIIPGFLVRLHLAPFSLSCVHCIAAITSLLGSLSLTSPAQWDIFHSVTKVKIAQSCLTLQHHGLYSPWNSPDQNTGVGSLPLLQGIFPT